MVEASEHLDFLTVDSDKPLDESTPCSLGKWLTPFQEMFQDPVSYYLLKKKKALKIVEQALLAHQLTWNPKSLEAWNGKRFH